MAYISRSCDFLKKVKLMASKFPKKEIFDGLHKHFFDDKNTKFPFMEILMAFQKRKILMVCISVFLMMKMQSFYF